MSQQHVVAVAIAVSLTRLVFQWRVHETIYGFFEEKAPQRLLVVVIKIAVIRYPVGMVCTHLCEDVLNLFPLLPLKSPQCRLTRTYTPIRRRAR